MDILKWNNSTWDEIPTQDKPNENEECLIICKREYIAPPYINTGNWEVLHWRQDEKDEMNWNVFIVALFWDFENAELFSKAFANALNDCKL